MTAADGFPPDMNPFTLDAGTADRLVTGAVDVGDAPPQYRTVARLFHALRAEPDSSELAGQQVTINRIAETVVLERRVSAGLRPRPRRPRVSRMAAASLVSCVLLAGGLAGAGALPNPAQRFASAVLSQVGISVPSGDEERSEQEPRPATSSPVARTAVPPVQPTSGDHSSETPPPTPTNATEGSPPSRARADRQATPTPELLPPSASDSGTAPTPEPSPLVHESANATANEHRTDNGNNGSGNNANGNALGNPNEKANARSNGNGHAYGVANGNGAPELKGAAKGSPPIEQPVSASP
jgi:hypothetical protein